MNLIELKVLGLRFFALILLLGMIQVLVQHPEGSLFVLRKVLSGSLCIAALAMIADKVRNS